VTHHYGLHRPYHLPQGINLVGLEAVGEF
jgi:hypothetical protein